MEGYNMEREKLLELINMDLDGVISGDEKRILQEYLQNNPDAKKIYEDNVVLSKMLSSEPALNPSENIKKVVMNTISLKPVENKQKDYSNTIFKFLRKTAMSMDPTKKKKVLLVTSFISIIIVAIIVVAIFTPTFRSSQSGEITDGTIGKAKKYYAQQMSEKDIVLRNALLNYKEDLNKAISELNQYKKFVSDFDSDLGVWITRLSGIEAKSKEKNAPKTELDKYASQLTILKNVKTFVSNKGILDSTLMMFADLSKSDTLNKNFPVDNSLIDLKKFMDQVSIKFVEVFNTLPDVSETFKKNGEPEILVIKPAKEMKDKVAKIFKDKKMNQALVNEGFCGFFVAGCALNDFFNQNNVIVFFSPDKQSGMVVNASQGFTKVDEKAIEGGVSNVIEAMQGCYVVGGKSNWCCIENSSNNIGIELFGCGLVSSALFNKQTQLGAILSQNYSGVIVEYNEVQ
jgi:hypothetical protein